MIEETTERDMSEVIRIDEAGIKDHLGEMVRGTVEEALNAMLNAEAGAARCATSAGKVAAIREREVMSVRCTPGRAR